MTLYQKFKKLLHLESRPKPEIDLNTEIYLKLRPFTFPLILTVLLMMVGTLGYIIIDDFDLMSAIYQTGITFTTVGYGEFGHISKVGQIFTISLIIFGFIIFSFAIGLIMEVINKGELTALLKERRMLYKIARLKRHFVVCYHNDYTIQVANQLRINHIPFVVIDPREDLEEIAKKYKYPYFIKEEPHTQIALLKSHLSSAKGVISLSGNIADNIAQIASTRLYEKELNRKAYHIITNAKTLNDIEKLKKLGADEVISPAKLMAKKIISITTHPDIENIIEELAYRKDIPLAIQEIKIPKHSWIIYKKLRETKIRKATGATIVAIKDENGKFIAMPKSDTLIKDTATLFLIGTEGGIKSAKRLIRKKEEPEELQYV